MRGEAGTEVNLSVLSEGDEKPRTVTLKRDRIQVESVKSELLEPGYGYLRISHSRAAPARTPSGRWKRWPPTVSCAV